MALFFATMILVFQIYFWAMRLWEIVQENESGLLNCSSFRAVEQVCHHKIQKGIRFFASEQTGGSGEDHVELVCEKINDKKQMGVGQEFIPYSVNSGNGDVTCLSKA